MTVGRRYRLGVLREVCRIQRAREDAAAGVVIQLEARLAAMRHDLLRVSMPCLLVTSMLQHRFGPRETLWVTQITTKPASLSSFSGYLVLVLFVGSRNLALTVTTHLNPFSKLYHLGAFGSPACKYALSARYRRTKWHHPLRLDGVHSSRSSVYLTGTIVAY